ncbi:hypothetical protein [Nocardioides pacificus]
MSVVRRGREHSTWRAPVAAVAAALTLVLAAGAVPSAGAVARDRSATTSSRGESDPTTAAVARRARTDAAVRVQRVTVKWTGTDRRKRFTRTAVVPGIGHATFVCRPGATMLRLYASDRSAETQMWIAKYETKSDRAVVAVKVPRIYTFSDAADDGTGGTGRYAHEGLNQRTRIENHSSGYLHGVISQRPGRHQPAGAATTAPATSFRLDWWWNGFHHPPRYRSCSVKAVFKTRTDVRPGLDWPELNWPELNWHGLNWHGDADALGHEETSAPYPAIGRMSLRCETGRNGDASFWLTPTASDARVWVEYVTGEGLVENHVETIGLGYDDERGTVGPLDLPQNGMLRLWWTVAGQTRAFIVSSYRVTNNVAHPKLNVCEVAVAPW